MKTIVKFSALALALAALAAPLSVQAARPWLAPSSAYVDGGKDPVLTVDGAVSEDLFEFDRGALQLDGISITAPDGSSIAAEAVNSTRRRSSFEFKLTQPGTYRIANVSDTLSATYKVGTETKRWRGTAETFAKEVPADATDLNVSRMLSRVETFATKDDAGGKALAPAGVGLELIPLTTPTDLSVGDKTQFRLLLNGKPLSNTDVTVVRGANRYRYKLGEVAVKTDAKGEISIPWAEAGRYWLGASVGGRGGPGPGGPGAASAPQQPVGTLAAPTVRASCNLTVEVLPK